MVVTLVMLMAALLLGLAAAQSAVQSWKVIRNDTDRLIAFQAAEAALLDAELDIEESPDPARSRSHIFSKYARLGFPDDAGPVCNRGSSGIYRGLCRNAGSETAIWQTADFSDNESSTESVPFGTFTGRQMQSGKGALPSRLPRYIIELMTYHQPGEPADKPSYFYRVTAVGYGARETTQVALQSFYRKEDK